MASKACLGLSDILMLGGGVLLLGDKYQNAEKVVNELAGGKDEATAKQDKTLHRNPLTWRQLGGLAAARTQCIAERPPSRPTRLFE